MVSCLFLLCIGQCGIQIACWHGRKAQWHVVFGAFDYLIERGCPLMLTQIARHTPERKGSIPLREGGAVINTLVGG
jgi:hypothetical protein